MRFVFALVLLVGVGLAGFAVYMAQGYLAKTSRERDALMAERALAKPLIQVYAVTTPKKYGERITKEDVVKILWQKDSVPEGAFLEEEALFPVGAEPRVVLRQMEQFEPILAVKVTEPGEDAGLTSRLGKGFRAFTISVDVSSGVSGFLRPGDKVDVYWTGRAFGRGVTRLIEASVPIIAVDQVSDSARSGPQIARTVTVQVSRQQVAALAQAQSTGRLSLSLVGTDDDATEEVVEVDQNTLLDFQEPVQVQAPAPKRVCYARVRRGAEVVNGPVIPCPDE
ncbi:Flp pilus assembly protein CpaB [Actibacterium sp. 188UL27-1]|uniref:Flp pilus assembly protein CpaB n=1 Tax=Actibacterium sp. 188UL27-1 TaxID=2786961 RepID=UPI00195D7E7A|nr:Flp pilus assembly protein CpaB [Actibacterium sp. 188UL27-1]MBM7068212.1 Flp pilus assembly protein CpaB [Actibacterium sp. 188UL27-1]